MKKLTLLVVVLMMSVVAVFADSVEPKDFNNVKKTLIRNLKVENLGVRNSTLHLIAKIRCDYPNADMNDLNHALVRMAKSDRASYLRAGANLTYAYINNAELVEKVKVVDPENPAVFFSALYSTVHNELLNLAD